MADEAYSADDEVVGDQVLDAAKGFVDLALDFVPGISAAKDAYSLYTGRNPITGELLSNTEMGFIAVGLFIPSFISGSAKVIGKLASKVAKKSGKAGDLAKRVVDAIGKFDKSQSDEILGESLDKVFDSAMEIGFRSADDIKQNLGVIQRWSPNFKKTKIDDATTVNASFNARGMESPYLKGTKVVEFETTGAETFVRVHGPSNQARVWIMKQSDIAGLSAAEIANKYNIPDIPTTLSRADIPVGTRIRTGVVGPTESFGKSQGAIQFEILKERVPPEWFTKIGDL